MPASSKQGENDDDGADHRPARLSQGGESEQRLHALVAWRESPFFTRRERAALALTEAVTLIHGDQLPDEVYSAAEAEFDGDELSQLLWVVIVINSLNRVAISSRLRPARS